MNRGRAILLVMAPLILSRTVAAMPAEAESSSVEPDTVEVIPTDSPTPSACVITEEEIRRSGALVLGEIIHSIPGFEVIDRGYLGSEKELSWEGYPSDHLLILIDGEVVNDVSDGSFDINRIPLASVERVEYVRNASLLTLDSRASGGAIHIRTKRYAGGGAFTRLALAGGSFGTDYQEGLFQRGLLDQKIGLSIAFDRISTGDFGTVMDDRAFQYQFRVEESRWDGIDLSFSGIGTKSSGELTGSGDSISVDTEKEFRHLKLRAVFNADGTLPIAFHGYYSNNREDSLVRGNSPATSSRRGELLGVRFSGHLRTTRSLDVAFGAAGERHDLGGEDEFRTLSLFTGAILKHARWPRVEVMGRWEREGSRYAEWSGGVTVTYSLNELTEVFTSIIDARHLPSFAGRDITGPDGDARKERVAEAGFAMRRGAFIARMAGFGRRSEPVCCFAEEIQGSGSPGETRLGVSGIRFDIGTELGRHLNLSAGYQVARVGDIPSGITGLSIPRHHLTGRIEIAEEWKDGKIRFSWNIAGNMVRGRDQAASADFSGDDRYGYVDMNSRFRMVDVTFFYTLRNVTDSVYEIVQGFPMPGRAARFGFRWDFFD